MIITDVNNNPIKPGDVCIVESDRGLTIQLVSHIAESTVVFTDRISDGDGHFEIYPKHNMISYGTRYVRHSLCSKKVFNLSEMPTPFTKIRIKH